MGQIPDRDKHTQSCKTRIIYDTEGEAQGIELSASSDTECNSLGIFLYRKNLQGNITGLINTDGKLLCEFTYDAYGNMKLHTESNLGAIFSGILSILFIPQLYRGYVYTVVGDEMCYYLGSRFYSPKLGRFLNADIHADTGTGVVGTNMFAYCNNNPVMFVDPTGEAMEFIIKFLSGIIKIIKQFFNIFSSKTESIDYNELFLFAAVMYAEGGGESELFQRAISQTVMNRVGKGEWKAQTTVTAVLTAKSQYQGYSQGENTKYRKAMAYYQYGEYSSVSEKNAMDKTLQIVKKVYTHKDTDISKGATFFYTNKYTGKDWEYADSYTRVYIDGIDNNVYFFYK